MSRAQTVWGISVVVATVVAGALFSLLPFLFWTNCLIAGLAFLIIGGFGHRYFRTHATPEEIRQDLENRKNFPG